MGEQTRAGRMTTTLLSLAIVERLDAIIAEVRERGDAGVLGALDSYGRIVDWASDLACEHGTAEQWATASREGAHVAANLGSLTLVEIEVGAMRAIEGALAGAQGTVTYTPTPSTAIAWYLDVARAAGFEAPGEDRG
jgi:hypothetical protein